MDAESKNGDTSPGHCEIYDIQTYTGEFEVEGILGRQWRHGWPFYCVKWKVWPNQWNTWEPVYHMVNSIETVIAFEEGIIDDGKGDRTWLPEGDKWKLKLPKKKGSHKAFLNFIRECLNAERKILAEAQEVASDSSELPTKDFGNQIVVMEPEPAVPVHRDTASTGTTGLVAAISNVDECIEESAGPISTFNFDVYNEDTESLEDASHSTLEPSPALASTVPDTIIHESHISDIVTCGMNSADGETVALNFACSTLPWVRTASIMKSESDSVCRRQPQVASSFEHGRNSMSDWNLGAPTGQVHFPDDGECTFVENSAALPTYKQKKCCSRKRKYRQNRRRKKAEAKSMIVTA